MQTQARQAHETVGVEALLDYPGEGMTDVIEALCERSAETCPEAAQALRAFQAAVEPLDPGQREELYVKTFDFAPLCAPYVGAHLIAGNGEGFKRSEFLAALAGAYREAGFDTGGELPDHLALVLRFRTRLAPEEREELARLCLLPAAMRMEEELVRNENPYRHVLRAIRCLIQSELSESMDNA